MLFECNNVKQLILQKIYSSTDKNIIKHVFMIKTPVLDDDYLREYIRSRTVWFDKCDVLTQDMDVYDKRPMIGDADFYFDILPL